MANLPIDSSGTNANAEAIAVSTGNHTLAVVNNSTARAYITFTTSDTDIVFTLDATYAGGRRFTPPHVLRDNPQPGSDPTSVRLQLDGGEQTLMRVTAGSSGQVRVLAGDAQVGHVTENHVGDRIYFDTVDGNAI